MSTYSALEKGCRINCLESKGKKQEERGKKGGRERRKRNRTSLFFLVFNQFCYHHKKYFVA